MEVLPKIRPAYLQNLSLLQLPELDVSRLGQDHLAAIFPPVRPFPGYTMKTEVIGGKKYYVFECDTGFSRLSEGEYLDSCEKIRVSHLEKWNALLPNQRLEIWNKLPEDLQKLFS